MKNESYSVVSNSLRHHGLYSPWNSPGQNTGVGSPSLLQGIFPTQESNLGLPHCRRILYQLSHKVSPSILAWIAIPSPGDLPDPGFEPGSPVLQVDSLPTELSGKPKKAYSTLYSQAVSHPSTNQAWPCFAFKIRRDRVHSGWYGGKTRISYVIKIMILILDGLTSA